MAELQEVLEKLDLVNDVKLEIKDVISTDSLHFEDYPNLIARHLVNTPTEQTIADRTTANGATIADGIAFIKTIKGNSLKWNQLSNNLNVPVITSNGITFTKNADGSVSASGTATSSAYYIINLSATSGHKYALVGNPTGTSYGTYCLTAYGSSALVTTGKDAVFTPSANIVSLRIIVWNRNTINTTFKPMLFDLTAMGWEDITSADQFAQRLGFISANELPSYPYDEGSIKNFSASQLVTKGTRRVVDLGTLNWAIYNGFAYATNADSLNAVTFTTAMATIPIYHVNDSNLPSITEMYIQAIDQVLRVRNIGTMSAAEVKEAMNGVMLNYASTELSTLDTLPLPSIELLSAGSASDEYEPSTGKLTKRIGVKVFDGTEGWNRNAAGSGLQMFYLHIPDIKVGSEVVLDNKDYRFNPSFAYQSYDKTIWESSWWLNQCVNIIDMQYTSVAEWKTHLAEMYAQGTPLVVYYAIATPIESTTDKAKAYYKVENGGKEIVDTTTSSPLKADIGYQS